MPMPGAGRPENEVEGEAERLAVQVRREIARRGAAFKGEPPGPVPELARLRREFDTLVDRVRAVERRLSNRDFVIRAPAEIVARERGRRDELVAAVTEMRRDIESLEEVRE